MQMIFFRPRFTIRATPFMMFFAIFLPGIFGSETAELGLVKFLLIGIVALSYFAFVRTSYERIKSR